MKKQIKYYCFLTIAFLMFFSCQRELNFENNLVSAGSLKSDLTKSCLPKTVAGTYIEGKDLSDSNYIEVDVNVTSPGPYLIITDTVNGYSFAGTGIFTSTGSNTVKLTGKGKPIATGNNNFIVMYYTSSCLIQVDVAPVAGNIIPAAFALQGAPDSCIPGSVFGNYIKGRSVNSEDTVVIGLMVTTPGSFEISTNTVNGYKFLGSGVLTRTGLQTVTLTATGVPLNAGINIFTVTGASGCTFSVTVATAVAVFSNDYYPLTKNSYWSYNNFSQNGDTIKRIIADTVRKNSIVYRIMEEHDMFGGMVQSYFRKSGNKYLEYGSVDKYTVSLSYTPRLYEEIPFLKEYMVTGESWKTVEFAGTIFLGQMIFLEYHFYCIDANAAVILNGNAFINVCKIRVFPLIRSGFAPLSSTGETIDIYYAKGVGVIYLKGTRNGFSTRELKIKNWMVY